MKINKEFICEVIDVLNKLMEGKTRWTGNVEFVDKESGFKFKFYEITRSYYRLDIRHIKGEWLEPILIKPDEEESDDKIRED